MSLIGIFFMHVLNWYGHSKLLEYSETYENRRKFVCDFRCRNQTTCLINIFLKY